MRDLIVTERLRSGGWHDLRPLLSARASLLVMFGLFLLGDLTAGSVHLAALTGFGFAAGSAIAAGCTRRPDLLIVVTTPPAIFVAAVTCGELITMHLNHVSPSAGLVGENILLTLTSAAPWLFFGLAGAVLIATVRGLRQCVRELRAELAGAVFRRLPVTCLACAVRAAARRPSAPAPPRPLRPA